MKCRGEARSRRRRFRRAPDAHGNRRSPRRPEPGRQSPSDSCERGLVAFMASLTWRPVPFAAGRSAASRLLARCAAGRPAKRWSWTGNARGAIAPCRRRRLAGSAAHPVSTDVSMDGASRTVRLPGAGDPTLRLRLAGAAASKTACPPPCISAGMRIPRCDWAVAADRSPPLPPSSCPHARLRRHRTGTVPSACWCGCSSSAPPVRARPRLRGTRRC